MLPTPAPLSLPETDPVDAPEPTCPNCGCAQVDAYCAACGQKTEPLRQPVSHFLGDSFTEYFGLDGRLWRTLGLLFFRPGQLTRAYFEGRRVGYLRPLRIYLTATLAFFFLLSILDPVGQLEGQLGVAVEADTTMRVEDHLTEVEAALAEYDQERVAQARAVDSLRVRLDSLRAGDVVDDALPERLDDLVDEVEDGERDLMRMGPGSHRRRMLAWQVNQLRTWPADSLINPTDLFNATVLLFEEPAMGEFNTNLPEWLPRSRSVQQLQSARTSQELARAIADYARSTLAQLPTVMFLLLPVFALLLKGIYGNRRWRTMTHPLRWASARLRGRPPPPLPPTRWYYTEHLVFALHTHAYAFLVFALMAMLVAFSGGAAWAATVSSLLLLWIPVYFYVAQKRVYGQGWIKTAVKALILAWLYGWLLFGLGLALALVLAAVSG